MIIKIITEAPMAMNTFSRDNLNDNLSSKVSSFIITRRYLFLRRLKNPIFFFFPVDIILSYLNRRNANIVNIKLTAEKMLIEELKLEKYTIIIKK
jgi:hypothetical protein